MPKMRPPPGPSPLSRLSMSWKTHSPPAYDQSPHLASPTRHALSQDTITSPPGFPPSPKPPPNTPIDWFWKCHRCNHAYRLSCTSRCLDCGHPFCGAKPSSSSPRPSARRRAGTCLVYFDTDGWDAWGLWRRASAFPGQHDEDARAVLFEAGTHDCSMHCDYPTQCKQIAAMRRRVRQREAEEREAAERVQSALELLHTMNSRVPAADAVSPLGEGQEMSWFSSSGSGDEDIEMEYFEDILDRDVTERVLGERAMLCTPVSPVSPVDETDVFFGAPCGMDGEEWREEQMLGLGHAETRTEPWEQDITERDDEAEERALIMLGNVWREERRGGI